MRKEESPQPEKTEQQETPDTENLEQQERSAEEYSSLITTETEEFVDELETPDEKLASQLSVSQEQFKNASGKVQFRQRVQKLVDLALQAKQYALEKIGREPQAKIDASLGALDSISQAEHPSSKFNEWMKAVAKQGDMELGLQGLLKAEEMGIEGWSGAKQDWVKGCADKNLFELATSYLDKQEFNGESTVLSLVVKAAETGKLGEFGMPQLLSKLIHETDGRLKSADVPQATRLLKSLIKNRAALKTLPKEATDYILSAYFRKSNWDRVATKGVRDVTKEWDHQSQAFFEASQAQLERMNTEESGEYLALQDMIETNPQDQLLFHNVEMMQELEQENPGVVTSLYKNYGIRNFQRYPKELLLQQDKEKDADMPYGVVMNGVADHNGNFSRDARLYNSFDQDLDNVGHGVRVVEAANKEEVSTRLGQLNEKYGGRNKIEFMILGGHGQPGDIQLGPNEDNHEDKILQTDLKNTALVNKSEYFTDDAEVVLNSCLVGTEQGFAQNLSTETGRTVTASNESISPVKLEAKLDEYGKIKVDIEFNISGSKVKYNKGKPV